MNFNADIIYAQQLQADQPSKKQLFDLRDYQQVMTKVRLAQVHNTTVDITGVDVIGHQMLMQYCNILIIIKRVCYWNPN